MDERVDIDAKRQLGARVRAIRLKRGLTQKELADAAGVGESALRSYELGARYPKQKQIESIARALKVRPEAIQCQAVFRPLELLHLLFRLEKPFDLLPSEDGAAAVESRDFGVLQKGLSDWGKKKRELDAGEITADEYEDWKDSYSPWILSDWMGEEVPDPYTGKTLVGEERVGAVHARLPIPDELQERLEKLHSKN